MTRRLARVPLRRRLLAALLVVVVAIGMLAGGADVAERPARKLLFIGIDGVRADVLKAAYTPYLKGLMRGGAFAYDTQILGERYRLNDTVSAPGWSSLLTGVWADKHGVNGRAFQGARFGDYPNFLQRLKRARPEVRTAVFVSWPAIAQHIVTSADVLKVFPPEDESAASYLEADRHVSEAARRHLVEDDPDALFVYWAFPDAVGHKQGFGRHVREYRRAIETVDHLTGVLLRAMRARENFPREEWLVVVSSDHGGKGTHHRNGHQDPDVLTVFLIVSGPAAMRGRMRYPTFIVDAATTALGYLGVDSEDAWGLDGRVVGLKPR